MKNFDSELKQLITDLQVDLQSSESVNSCLKVAEIYLNSELLKNLIERVKSAEISEKKILGEQLNSIRKSIKNEVDIKILKIQELQEKDDFDYIDPTVYIPDKMYKSNENRAHLHPISVTTNEICQIFKKMGFDVFSGNQIESQYYNFTVPGTPSYHPARGMQDTFFLSQKDELNENYVMRTQVTASIGHYAAVNNPPFKVVFEGIVFRAENMDSTHDINFNQFDMWMVDENLSVSQVFSIIKKFFKEFFDDPDLQVRMRPSYFPFTQPSFEIDIFATWFKSGQWIEVAGVGPIHNNVLQNIGIDPKIWSGLAFGFGLTRLCQLKNKVTGITQFYNGELEFLRGE